MEKRKATFNLSKELLYKLESLPRNTLPNKSHLVDALLTLWYETTIATRDKHGNLYEHPKSGLPYWDHHGNLHRRELK